MWLYFYVLKFITQLQALWQADPSYKELCQKSVNEIQELKKTCSAGPQWIVWYQTPEFVVTIIVHVQTCWYVTLL